METFVIRIWVPGPGDDTGTPLRGFVEHVRRGERQTFDGAVQLLAFLEAAVARHLDTDPRHPEGDRP